ncbi:MAG TPA: RNA-directed DNA polymerase (Reverse transcriptase), partial [Flavobacterium sp.]
MEDWFKDRGYPHFTHRTPLAVKAKILRYINNPDKVAKHSFAPFILKTLSQRRYKLSTFGKIEKRSHKILSNGITKSNEKIREILYATHIDAHIYSYYSQEILSDKYEKYLESNIHISTVVSAYRQIPTFCKTKFKNNMHFAKDVFDEIKIRQNCVALAFDIENFFPSLNHRLLKLIWSKMLNCKALPPDHYNIFKSVTNFSYVKLQDLKTKKRHFDEKELSKLKKKGNILFQNIAKLIDSPVVIHKNQKHRNGNLIGIPQGLPI